MLIADQRSGVCVEHPLHLPVCRNDERRRDIFRRPLGGKDLFHDRRLARSGDKKESLAGIIDDGKRKRHPPAFNFRNKNRNDAPLLFIQRGGAGEERGDVAVFAEPEKNQIESRDGMCEE